MKAAPSCRHRGENSPWRAAPRAQTLAGNAVPEREQALAGPAVRVRLRRSASGRQTRPGRRTGVGNHPLGQANYLPQCAVTYPNATAHPPQQYPAAEKLPPIAYPNARLPIPLRECARRGSCGDSATGIQRYPVRGAVECGGGVRGFAARRAPWPCAGLWSAAAGSGCAAVNRCVPSRSPPSSLRGVL